MEKGLLIEAEKFNGKMVTSLLYNNIFLKCIFNNITQSAVSLAYCKMTSRYDTRIVRKSIAIRYDFSESLQLYL